MPPLRHDRLLVLLPETAVAVPRTRGDLRWFQRARLRWENAKRRRTGVGPLEAPGWSAVATIENNNDKDNNDSCVNNVHFPPSMSRNDDFVLGENGRCTQSKAETISNGNNEIVSHDIGRRSFVDMSNRTIDEELVHEKTVVVVAAAAAAASVDDQDKIDDIHHDTSTHRPMENDDGDESCIVLVPNDWWDNVFDWSSLSEQSRFAQTQTSA